MSGFKLGQTCFLVRKDSAERANAKRLHNFGESVYRGRISKLTVKPESVIEFSGNIIGHKSDWSCKSYEMFSDQEDAVDSLLYTTNNE